MNVITNKRTLALHQHNVARAFAPASIGCVLAVLVLIVLSLGRFLYPALGAVTISEMASLVFMLATTFLATLVLLQTKILDLEMRLVELEKKEGVASGEEKRTKEGTD